MIYLVTRPGIGDGDSTLVGVDGAEGEVFGSSDGGLGQDVEKSRLADVGQADDSDLQVGAHPTQEDHLLLFNLLLGRHSERRKG